MNRSLHIMTWTLLSFATVLGTGCPRQPAQQTAPSETSAEQPSPQNEADESASLKVDSQQATSEQQIGSSQLSQSDLERSSWENPFRPRLWSSDGWLINEESMTCDSASGQPATFLRPYRNVVIECRFSREGEVADGINQAVIEAGIRLLNQRTQRSTNLWLEADRLSLSETPDPVTHSSLPSWGTVLLREVSRVVDNENEVHLRLTLTPNRLLVAVDGQMIINVARPGSIRMSDCLVQVVASEPGTEISDLRFEGD